MNKQNLQFLTIILTAAIIAVGCNEITQTPVPAGIETCELTGGRTISYMEYGQKDGIPVLYFHGFPGSHEDVHLFNGAGIADKLNIRLIAINRPGYAGSGSALGRTLPDWTDDVKELAVHMDLDSFSILGYSGGGPFALACAFAMPEQIHRVAIVSGMGPWDAPESKKGMAMTIPKAPKLSLGGMVKTMEKKPEKIEANMKKNMPEADLLVLEDPGMTEAFMNTLHMSLGNGYEGALQDAKIYKNEWGFDLSRVEIPVYLYHGGEDLNVKVETANYVLEQIPGCRAEIAREEGHLSLIVNQAEEILEILIK